MSPSTPVPIHVPDQDALSNIDSTFPAASSSSSYQNQPHQVPNQIDDDRDNRSGSSIPFEGAQSPNNSAFFNDMRHGLALLHNDTHSTLDQNLSLDADENCCATPCLVNKSPSNMTFDWTECSSCH